MGHPPPPKKVLLLRERHLPLLLRDLHHTALQRAGPRPRLPLHGQIRPTRFGIIIAREVWKGSACRAVERGRRGRAGEEEYQSGGDWDEGLGVV